MLCSMSLILRFIPAGAGNPGWQLDRMGWIAVYPRWRGELYFFRLVDAYSAGLSPLARGTQRVPFGFTYANRFIPAGAGNSERAEPEQNRSSVYPRWRGELFSFSSCLFCVSGLSPLARGTLATSRSGHAHARFIPAGAGNSQRRI